MSSIPTQKPAGGDLNHALKHIVEERNTAVEARNGWDARVKTLNDRIMTVLSDAATERTQLHDGTVVSITRPDPRKTIVAEKLLGLGVDPDVITAATKLTNVAPYVRVDAPKAAGAEDAEKAPKVPASPDARPADPFADITH